MSIHLTLCRQGFTKALQTTLLLAKIVIPVTVLIVALEQMELLNPLAQWFNPFLKAFGLPGEASLALLLGFFVNIYAAIGAITVLSLSGREITVIAVMILTSHSLPMEGPVLKFTGLSPLISTLLRIGAALGFGYLVNLIYLLAGVA